MDRPPELILSDVGLCFIDAKIVFIPIRCHLVLNYLTIITHWHNVKINQFSPTINCSMLDMSFRTPSVMNCLKESSRSSCDSVALWVCCS